MPIRQPPRLGEDFGKVVGDLAKFVEDLVASAIGAARSFIESGVRRLETSQSYGHPVARSSNEWSQEGLAAARESGLQGDDLGDWALGNSPENVDEMEAADRLIERARQSGSDVGSALRRAGYRPLTEVRANLDDSHE